MLTKYGWGRDAAHMHVCTQRSKTTKTNRKKRSAKQIKKIGAQYRSVGIEWKDKIEMEADIGGVCHSSCCVTRTVQSPALSSLGYTPSYFIAFRMQPQVVFYCF